MWLIVQLPIADARPFFPGAAGDLRLPQWPPDTPFNSPQPPTFVRCFGPATQRRQGADLAFVDEGSYFRANRAVRLKSLGARVFGLPEHLRTACVFRRLLLSERRAVVRVEMGVHLPLSAARLSLDFPRLIKIAESALRLPSTVRGPKRKPVLSPLWKQGGRLAELYASVTTDNKASSAAALVEAGLPLLVVQYKDGELTPDCLEGTYLTRIDPVRVRGAALAMGWLELPGGPIVPLWLLGPGTAQSDELRSLRLCILRLHAEQVVLDRILRNFDRLAFIPGTQEGDRLEAYLNEATRLINRGEWDAYDQSAIREAFDAAEAGDARGNRAELSQRYLGARRQIHLKIDDYERRRAARREITVIQTTVTGGVAIVDSAGVDIGDINIKDIYANFEKKASGEDPGKMDDLKKAMAVLCQQVDSLVARMPEGSAAREQVLGNLESLADQATKKKPLPDVVKVTGKGLVEAAKTVAEMAEPIAKAVMAVVTLFGIIVL
jgi:hypothetical protein